MILYVSSSGAPGRRIHSRPDCYRLVAGMHRRRTSHAIAITDHMAVNLLPCRTCYGDVMPTLYKPYCQLCGTWRACGHNGGVAVWTKTGFGWSWPEHAGRHRPLREA